MKLYEFEFKNDNLNLFEIKKSKVKKVDKKNEGVFKTEKEMQKLFEKDLEEILDINFIYSEYPTADGKIDTLGVDKNEVPCIIEYKKANNGGKSIVTQGNGYSSWFKEHKDHRYGFERICKEKDKNIEINWNRIRIICIAHSYDKDDIKAASDLQSKNKEISLYCYSKHNDILSLYLLFGPKTNKSKETHENQCDKTKKSIVGNTLKLFLYSDKKKISTGKYKYKNKNEFWVLARSKVCKNTTPKCPDNIKKLRKEKLKDYYVEGQYYILKKDVQFKSPSAAANFCLGSSRSGNEVWKDKNGHSLNDLTGSNVEYDEPLQESYTIDDHLKNKNEQIKNLFKLLQEKILSLDGPIIKDATPKVYISYALKTKWFVRIVINKSEIKILLTGKYGMIKDPLKLISDVTKTGHIGNNEVILKNENDLEKVFALIQQSYKLTV